MLDVMIETIVKWFVIFFLLRCRLTPLMSIAVNMKISGNPAHGAQEINKKLILNI
ncbi:hypothetical protein RhiirA5_436087 [Rhizophagus irregularis]|uniref:Uncharacterized protein n=1 Tax=Rhizophagus irregularis TaxID=588596 RepID=A0A2N0NMF4_9GLOM|nr:hypothetical protein RhiirA5_436087 [Rhizophagus irregularis]